MLPIPSLLCAYAILLCIPVPIHMVYACSWLMSAYNHWTCVANGNFSTFLCAKPCVEN